MRPSPFDSPYGSARRSWQDVSPATWALILAVAALAGWWFFNRSGATTSLTSLALRFVPQLVVLLVAMPVHEFAHAATAVWLGDETPRIQGRLTLNPAKHLDVLGTVLLLTVGMGWAKPVMWNPANIRSDVRLGTLLVAAAGPLSNILLAFLAIMVVVSGQLGQMSFGTWTPFVVYGMQAFIQINLLLAVFNLIPVPPLDGSHILFALLPPQFSQIAYMLRQYGILLILFVVWFMPNLIRGAAGGLEAVLYGLAAAAP